MADFGSALWNKPTSGDTGEGGGASDPVTRSLRFDNTSYLSFTPSAATTTRKKAVINFWFKLAEPESSSARNTLFFTAGTVQGSPTEWFGIKYDANTSKITIGASFGSADGATTAAVFRDYCSWYNLHLIVDTTESLNSNKFKLYINGVLQTLTGTFPTLNSNLHIGSDKPHRFGWQTSIYHSTTFGPQVYIANAYLLENSALPFTDFIEDTGFGSYKPKETSGLTFGTNGFHLDFKEDGATTSSNSGVGKDVSGNGNYFATTNISRASLDTPTKNYAVFNPLYSDSADALTEGNCQADHDTGGSTYYTPTTVGVNTGKFYFEVYAVNASTGGTMVGVVNESATGYVGSDSNGVGYHDNNGTIYNNGNTGTSYDTFTTGDIIGCAFDADTKKVWFAKNNSWNGSPTAGTGPAATLSGTLFAAVRAYTGTLHINAGADPTFAGNKSSGQDTSQSEFYYAPPSSDFKSLSSANLTAPITPTDYFEISQWVGNETAGKVISTDISPDLVWIKNRDVAKNHTVGDSVRGANKALFTNNTNTESTATTNITAFDTDATGGYSFTLGASEKVNDSGKNHVGWVWKESASAGFDIVTYEGDSEDEGTTQSISHSLGVTPEMIIVKARDGRAAGDYYAEDSWYVWHKDLTSGTSIFLNSTSAASSYSFSGAAPISSVGSSTFTVCNSVEDDNYYYDFLNWGDPYFSYSGDNERYIAYLFSSVEGYSKFGAYEGNGSTDGPFIYTGFRPRWIMVKPIDDPYAWYIHDTARSPYNYSDNELVANTSGVEYSVSGTGAGERFDILSNGFKHRTSNLAMNANNKTMIYATFAESSLRYSNAR